MVAAAYIDDIIGVETVLSRGEKGCPGSSEVVLDGLAELLGVSFSEDKKGTFV